MSLSPINASTGKKDRTEFSVWIFKQLCPILDPLRSSNAYGFGSVNDLKKYCADTMNFLENASKNQLFDDNLAKFSINKSYQISTSRQGLRVGVQ